MLRSPALIATVAAFGLVAPLQSQATPGQSVFTVSVTGATPPGEMYIVDHQARTSTPLTLSAALGAERPNCVLMVSGALGYIGTNPTVVTTPGNIYSISIAGNVVTETLLNTTPCAGPNVSQLAIVGTDIYFLTQDAANVGGILQHVPVAGGPVTTDIDLLSIVGVNGLGNSLCAIGTKVYAVTFDSGATANTGTVVEWDTTTSTASIVLQLPKSMYVSGASVFNVGPIHTLVDPLNANRIILVGVYGDVLHVDVVAGTVVRHDFSGAISGATVTINLLNSADFDPRTRDLIVGSRDGHAERICDGHSAEKIIAGVGSSATLTSNSVNGCSHIPAPAGTDYTNGAGCPGDGGYTLTASDVYLPTPGNSAFQFGVWSGTGGGPVVFTLGVANLNLDLFALGYSPLGCIYRSDLTISIGMSLSGTGNGGGSALLPLAIPPGAVGTLYTCWVGVRSTPPVIVVSNGRRLTMP